MKKAYQAPEMNTFLDVYEDVLTTSSGIGGPVVGAFWGEDDPLEEYIR